MCDEWLKNKTKNPTTGRTIKVGGPKYKQLEKDCISPSTSPPKVSKSPSKSPKKSDDCETWLSGPKTHNPTTGRAIKVGGPKYKQLEKDCKEDEQPSLPKDDCTSTLSSQLSLPSQIIQVNYNYRIPDSIKGPFDITKKMYKHYGYLIQKEYPQIFSKVEIWKKNEFLKVAPYFIYSYGKFGEYTEPTTEVKSKLDLQDFFEICVALRVIYTLNFNFKNFDSILLEKLKKEKKTNSFYEIIIDDISYYIPSRSHMMVIRTNGLMKVRGPSEYYNPLEYFSAARNNKYVNDYQNLFKPSSTNIKNSFFKRTFKTFMQLPKNGKVYETFNIPNFKNTENVEEEKFIDDIKWIKDEKYGLRDNPIEMRITAPLKFPRLMKVASILEFLVASPRTITRIPDNFYMLQNLHSLTLSDIATDLPALPDVFEFERIDQLTFKNVRSSNFNTFLDKVLKNSPSDMIVKFTGMQNVSINYCYGAKQVIFINCNTVNLTNFTLSNMMDTNSREFRLKLNFEYCNIIQFPDVLPYQEMHIQIFRCGITGLHPSLLALPPYSEILLIRNEHISLSTYENLIRLGEESDDVDTMPSISITMPDNLTRQLNAGVRPMNHSQTMKYLFKQVHNTELKNIIAITDHRFVRWVNKLGQFVLNNCKLLIDLIPDILPMLKEMTTNEEFKEVAFEIMDDATSSCGDRVILSVLYLSIQYKMYTIKYDEDSIELIFETIMRGPYIMSILEQIAREKTATLRFFDEIEVYLAYPIMLRERFKIPIATQGMLFFSISAVSKLDIERAGKRVYTLLKDTENIINFLFTQSLWTKLLYHLYPDKPIEEDVYAELTRQLIDTYDLTIDVDYYE
jgi:hypothetical protein